MSKFVNRYRRRMYARALAPSAPLFTIDSTDVIFDLAGSRS
jgi:hypothetical protein